MPRQMYLKGFISEVRQKNQIMKLRVLYLLVLMSFVKFSFSQKDYRGVYYSTYFRQWVKMKSDKPVIPSSVYYDKTEERWQTDTNYLAPSVHLKIDTLKNSVKISALKLIGMTNAALEVIYERKTGKGFATQIMASWLLPSSAIHWLNNLHPKTKGFRTSLEEKYYYNWKKTNARGYIALEANYMRTQFQDIWRFGTSSWNDSINLNYEDTFNVRKQTLSVNVKWGYHLVVKHFSFDFYAGIGFRYKWVSHHDRINPTDPMEGTRHPSFYLINNKEGNRAAFSLPLGIRLGYAF